MTRELEVEVVKTLAALAMEPTCVAVKQLLKIYRDKAVERIVSCSPEELGQLQGEIKAYDKVLSRISGK